MVDAKTGIITRVAGDGDVEPYTQDYLGLYALTMRLHHPEGVAVNSAGDLFVADTQGQAIYEFSNAARGSFGAVRRLAGTGGPLVKWRRGRYAGIGDSRNVGEISSVRRC